MRTLVLLDKKIDKDEALGLLDEYGEFFEDNTTIKCTFWVERKDFTSVPTSPDSDGDLKPTYQYVKELTDEIHSRYGDYGVDHIIMWVHEDNFLFKGIWGTALAYVHRKYMFELCRWDKDNSTNTFNTLFHENGGHPHDTMVKMELGIDINPIIANHFGLASFSYDRDYVHGNSSLFEYIGRSGYKRDGRMLQLLAPYLRKSYQNRLDKHFAPVRAVQMRIITQLRKLIANWRK